MTASLCRPREQIGNWVLSLTRLSSFTCCSVDSFRPHSGSPHGSTVNTASNRVLVSLKGPWVRLDGSWRSTAVREQEGRASLCCFQTWQCDHWINQHSAMGLKCLASQAVWGNGRESGFVNTQDFLLWGTALFFVVALSFCFWWMARYVWTALNFSSVTLTKDRYVPTIYYFSTLQKARVGKEYSWRFVFRKGRSDYYFPNQWLDTT